MVRAARATVLSVSQPRFSAAISIVSSPEDPAVAPAEKTVSLNPNKPFCLSHSLKTMPLKEQTKGQYVKYRILSQFPLAFLKQRKETQGCRQSVAAESHSLQTAYCPPHVWEKTMVILFQDSVPDFEISIRNSPFREAKFPWTWTVNIQHEFSPPRTLIVLPSFSCQVQGILRFPLNIVSTTSANRSAFLRTRRAWHFCYQFF